MCPWLLWNSVGKRKHTLPRCDLNFPFQNFKCCIFTLAFWWYCTNSLVSLETPEENVESAALELPPGLTRPRPCKPVFEKKRTSLSALFCCIHTSPEVYFVDTSVNSLICIHINTHFDMFLNNVTCMLVVLFFPCVWKHESKVPTNIITRMGNKTQCLRWKMLPFEWNYIPFLKLIIWQCGVCSNVL